jgi:branched-chain amino acid transport system permease protein
MEKLPSVTCAAIGFGIVSQAARYHYASDAYRSAIIGMIIVFALLIQRAGTLSRLSSAATSTWQETREVRAIPAELRHERAVRITRWALGFLLVLGIVSIAMILPGNRVQLVTVIAIYALIGVSLVVLSGWAGQISLGQMAFVAFGSAMAAELAARWHVDTGLILLASGAFGALIMVIVGMPTLRARGLAFPVITLAFGLVTSDFLLNTGYSPFREWLPEGSIERTRLLGVIPIATDAEFFAL